MLMEYTTAFNFAEKCPFVLDPDLFPGRKWCIFVLTVIYSTMKVETIDIQENADSQAIQIPQEFKINDDKVYIKKMGNALYIIPFHNPWQNLFDSLGQFTSDFMEDRNQPSAQIRESFD